LWLVFFSPFLRSVADIEKSFLLSKTSRQYTGIIGVCEAGFMMMLAPLLSGAWVMPQASAGIRSFLFDLFLAFHSNTNCGISMSCTKDGVKTHHHLCKSSLISNDDVFSFCHTPTIYFTFMHVSVFVPMIHFVDHYFCVSIPTLPSRFRGIYVTVKS
jgi:hypothetical protein